MDKTVHVFLKVDEKFEPKAKYVFRTMLTILGYKVRFFNKTTSEDIHIYYGLRTSELFPIRIYRGLETALFFNKKELYPEKNFNSVYYHGEYIPFLFSQMGEIFTSNGNSIQIRKDIIASAFYFLSCWHNFVQDKNHIQYDYKTSLPYRFHFAHIPVVERYCDILAEALQLSKCGYPKKPLWEKSFCVSLSHDIDFWDFWRKEDIIKTNSRLLKRAKSGSIGSLCRYLQFNIRKKTNCNRLSVLHKIIRKEAVFKSQSSFFLLTKKDFPHLPLNYFADDYYREEIIAALQKKTVNLQGSKESTENYPQLISELQELTGFSGNGFRARYLSADYQLLFKLLEQAKVKYDSSVGFDGMFGYRAGISCPFFPFNIKENRPFTVLEIPVAITDRTLFFPKEKHRKFLLQQLDILLKSAAQHQSHVSIIWHNHVFDPLEFPFLNKLYWKILQFANKQQASIFSTDDLYYFWMNRLNIDSNKFEKNQFSD
jgi:hypothetical protein